MFKVCPSVCVCVCVCACARVRVRVRVRVCVCVCVFRVTFRFRNSKKSNNGTDTNAGHIPQLLYRLPAVADCAPAASVIGRKADQSEAVHVLSRDFSRSVSPVRIDMSAAVIHCLSTCWHQCRHLLNYVENIDCLPVIHCTSQSYRLNWLQCLFV